MSKRIVHRGITVLALTTALALAGAHPAAAQDLGLFERGLRWLSSLWDMPVAQQPAVEHGAQMRTAAAGHSTSSTTDPNQGGGQTVVPGDKGLGVDPNGYL